MARMQAVGRLGRRVGTTVAVAAGLLATGGAAAADKTASFEVRAIHSGPGVQVTITSQVWITPKRARADVKHPLQGEVRFLVTDGFLYQLDPKTKRGIKGPLPDSFKKNPDNFAALVAQFAFDASGALKKAKKVRTEKVAGYQCDVLVNSQNAGGEESKLTIWVPQKLVPQIPVKAVVTKKITKPGATVNQSINITLANLKVNAAIPASVFAVPAGYKIESGAPRPPQPGE